ncbi:MAG: hypothetical protein ACK4TA_03040 [Saprospiraceae bacterium]
MKTLYRWSIILSCCWLILYSCNNNADNADNPQEDNTTYTDTSLSTIVVTADTVSARAIFASWNETPRLAAENIMQRYGAPSEHTPNLMIWYDNAPWHKTVVHRETRLNNNAAMNRGAILEQTIQYKVPATSTDELAQFSEQLIVDLGQGTLTARSNSEATNYLLLNLANDIVTQKKGVAEARTYYDDNLTAQNDYTKGFVFNYQQTPDEQVQSPDNQ